LTKPVRCANILKKKQRIYAQHYGRLNILYELMALMDAAAATGDDFPAKKLISIAVIAIGVMVLLGVISVALGKKEDDDEEDGQNGSQENNSKK